MWLLGEPQQIPKIDIDKVVIHGLNSGLATTEALQAKLAYKHKDVQLRMTLSEPHDRTTLSVCRSSLLWQLSNSGQDSDIDLPRTTSSALPC